VAASHAGPVDVVLADDSADVRGLVSLRLSRSGSFRVVGEGSTGFDAVDLARRCKPELLLLDVSMPGMDGLEALPKIRQASPDTRVVMFSGFEADDIVDEAMRRGAVDFIQKSIPIGKLVARLLDAVERPQSGQPAATPSPGTAAEVGRSADDKDAQAILGEHLERFRAVFDQAAIGVATLTLAGRFVRVNRALVELLAEPLPRVVGRFYSEFAPAADAQHLEAAVHELVSGKRAEVQFQHALNAVDAIVLSSLSSIRDRHGRPLYLLLQVQDLTASVQAAEELRRSEERFRLLVDGVVDYAIFMLDAEGRVSSWNAGAQRTSGYRPEDILGRHFRIFYTPEAQAARHPEAELRRAAAEGRYEEEGWRVRKDGSRYWASVVVTAIHNEDGELLGFAKVNRDISERQRAMEERERTAAELAATNAALLEANREKSDILATTAHEMRAPLTVIRGYVDLLAHRQDIDEGRRADMVAALEAQVDRLHIFVDDLLMAAQLEAGRLTFSVEPLALRPIIDEAVARMADTGMSGVAVECPSDITVIADKIRVEQMLHNYLSNADKYGAPPVAITASPEGRYVVVHVSDQGPGVAPYLEPRLFEKFSRNADATQYGAGLGLFIVRGLAEAQGGDAWYEGDGDGASFAFRLPAHSH
jgi:PAS domain S-box-containing protein